MPRGHRLNGLPPPLNISSISDPILAQIFAYLPPRDRLLVSEVCSRWCGVSRKAWLDIIHVNLNKIPSPSIGAVLRLSPNVSSVNASGNLLILNDLTEHYQMNLTSLRLDGVKLGIVDEQMRMIAGNVLWLDEAYRTELPWHRIDRAGRRIWAWQPVKPKLVLASQSRKFNRLVDCVVSWHAAANEQTIVERFTATLNRYFEKLPRLEELVLHNLSVVSVEIVTARVASRNKRPLLTITDIHQSPLTSFIPFSLTRGHLTHLARLELSGTRARNVYYAHQLAKSLRRLPQLECVILRVNLIVAPVNSLQAAQNADMELAASLASLKNLRELCLETQFFRVATNRHLACSGAASLGRVALKLPRLEVLVLIGEAPKFEVLRTIFTSHPTLRILMLEDSFHNEHMLPVRKFNIPAFVNPLPRLHVFIRTTGGRIRLRVADSPAANTVRFEAPLHSFLAQDGVSEILVGVWVAKMIRDSAQN